MRNRIIFALSILGIVAGLIAAYLFGIERKAQPPAFTPVSNPYATAIYAEGIVEGVQSGGSNINVYPEVAATLTKVLVHEGQAVKAGTALLMLDDTVQKATTDQLRLQAEAAQAVLQELQAQPRKETLAIAKAQAEQAGATLKAARDQYDKRRASYEIDPKSISKDVVDTAQDAVLQAATALDVARRQLELTQAGTWSYDIVNQRKQTEALQQAYRAANALLSKYAVRAQGDGVVLAVNASPGSYVASTGVYDTYTQAQVAPLVMTAPQDYLAVRCYIDEILVSRLPAPDRIQAQMSLRGSETKVPLEFVRVQPYLTPKIELSDQRQERVDVRVLPVIFRFKMTSPTMAYPGQLVDVFIGPTPPAPAASAAASQPAR
jgi:HlyD family secretion protein